MSDFNSSLPIRTELDGDVVVKVGDGLVPSQHLTVNADGSVNVTDNGGSLTVDATDLDIRDLSSAQDSVEVLQATHDNLNANVTIQVGDVDVSNANPVPVSDAGGSLTVDATDLDIRDLSFATDKVDVTGSDVTATVTATDLDIRDLAFATDKVDVTGSDVTATVTATDLDIRDLSFATDKVDVSGSSVTVAATDLDIRNLDYSQDNVAIKGATGNQLVVNSDGSINVVPQEDAGIETVNFNTAASIAAGATSNHDFVWAQASKLYQVLASASGKLKVEVQVESGASTNVFNTVAVGFNSTATPNIELPFAKYVLIPAGARVRVIRTNKDNQAQDVYSTMVGILGN